MLLDHLSDLIIYAKKSGMYVDLCTTGIVLTKEFLNLVKGSLNQIF